MVRKVLTVFGLGFLIIFGFVILGVNGDNYHTFKLNSFALDDELAINDRLCYLKVHNQVTSDGELFDSDNSPFLIDHPQLTFNFLATDAVNTQDSFIIEPRMKCIALDPTFGTTEERVAESKKILDACLISSDDPECKFHEEDLVVQSGQLNVKVISENIPSDTKIITFSKNFDIDRTVLTSNSEESLGSITIQAEDIFDDLDAGTYTTWQEFRISGELEIRLLDFENNPSIKSWKYIIPDESVPTFHQMILNKVSSGTNIDSDGDGIPDSNASDLQNDAINNANQQNQNTLSETTSDTIGLFAEFGDCLILGDMVCLNQGKFAVIWLSFAGLFGLAIFAIIMQVLLRRNPNA